MVGQKTLADFIDIPRVYPAGRLDKDSEGLLLLTDDGALQARIAEPRFKLKKSYWAQVEGDISREAIERLAHGIELKDGMTRPAEVEPIGEPQIPPRDPPVRYRKSIPTSWISITLGEGRNRQVRRMTAAAGFPTLRLFRHRIGHWQLDGLAPGEYQLIDPGAHDPAGGAY
jgi:23S rRNA pseudouridine2457 synthase